MNRRLHLALGLALATIAATLTGQPPAFAAQTVVAPHLFTPAACLVAPFADVSVIHPFCAWIQQFKEDQISLGCGGPGFCPDEPVTRQDLAAMLERAMRGTSSWEPWRGAFDRTLIVNPRVDDVDPVESGERLVEHFAEITDASATNRYLVRLEPGTYDLDGAALTLKPFVDLEGSGDGVTIIRSARSGGVLLGADDAEVRSLTVENTGSGSSSVAIDLSGDDATRLLYVTAIAGGGTGNNVAINNVGDGARLTNVTALAEGGGAALTVGIQLDGNATLVGVRAEVASAAGARAITAFNGISVIENSFASAFGGTNVYGINIETGASTTLRRTTATASSLTSGATAAGLHLFDGNASVYSSNMQGTATNAYGVLADQGSGSHTVRIIHSRLGGTDHSVQGDSQYTISMGDSQLVGGSALANGATLACYGIYDENFANAGGLTACP